MASKLQIQYMQLLNKRERERAVATSLKKILELVQLLHRLVI